MRVSLLLFLIILLGRFEFFCTSWPIKWFLLREVKSLTPNNSLDEISSYWLNVEWFLWCFWHFMLTFNPPTTPPLPGISFMFKSHNFFPCYYEYVNTQGFRSFVWTAVSYQLKDRLKLSPSASQFVSSIAFFPWSIKPLYGYGSFFTR